MYVYIYIYICIYIYVYIFKELGLGGLALQKGVSMLWFPSFAQLWALPLRGLERVEKLAQGAPIDRLQGLGFRVWGLGFRV